MGIQRECSSQREVRAKALSGKEGLVWLEGKKQKKSVDVVGKINLVGPCRPQ